MRARLVTRRPSAARTLRLPRALRALACTLPLAWVLGGGCVWAFSTNNHSDDNNNDGGTTVIVTSDTAGDTTGDADPSGVLAGLDPVLFQLEDVCSEVGSLRLAAPCSGETFAGLTPARIWPSESIGEPELAAFAAAVLRVNEEALRLPLPVSRLQYRDTAVADGAATVRFADRDSGELALAVEFGASGEVSSIERLAGDRSTKLR